VIKRTVPVLLAVVLLLAGVHWLNRRHDLETEGGDTLPPYPYAGAPWVEARVQGLRFALPKAFDDAIPPQGNQRVILGPAHNGYRPQWHVYRRTNKWSRQQGWWDDCEAKLRARFGESRVLEADVVDRVAGRPARKIVVEDFAVHPDGRRQRVLTTQWCWVRGDHAYWVRGIADADSFRSGHGALFDRIKSTVRHVDEDP